MHSLSLALRRSRTLQYYWSVRTVTLLFWGSPSYPLSKYGHEDDTQRGILSLETMNGEEG